MKASLRPEATERPQWPWLYLLGRPRSRGRMPTVVTVARCLECRAGLYLECAIYRWCYTLLPKGAERWLCVEGSHYIRVYPNLNFDLVFTKFDYTREYNTSLAPRPLPDFSSQLAHGCEIESGSGLGMRLCNTSRELVSMVSV